MSREETGSVLVGPPCEHPVGCWPQVTQLQIHILKTNTDLQQARFWGLWAEKDQLRGSGIGNQV